MIVDVRLRCLAPIHKHIALPAMSMHVDKRYNLILHVLLEYVLCEINRRVQNLGGLIPSTVEING